MTRRTTRAAPPISPSARRAHCSSFLATSQSGSNLVGAPFATAVVDHASAARSLEGLLQLRFGRHRLNATRSSSVSGAWGGHYPTKVGVMRRCCSLERELEHAARVESAGRIVS